MDQNPAHFGMEKSDYAELAQAAVYFYSASGYQPSRVVKKAHCFSGILEHTLKKEYILMGYKLNLFGYFCSYGHENALLPLDH